MTIIKWLSSALEWLWTSILTNTQLDIFFRIICAIAITLIVISLTVLVVAEAMEKLIKVIDWIKSNGLAFLKSDDIKSFIKKRRLFLQVLQADLNNIGIKENWNDQAFSELDAEVELEGAYYPSRVSRAYNDSIKGIRKTSSLTKAINFAAKKHLLVLGDPGSGKSVAMRHLAIQTAAQGIRSTNEICTVPIYINFRHFERQHHQSLDAQAIKSFVIDQIRNDSPSSSIFVEENWINFCENGSWLFLFDSFDEIPDILHSNDSDVKRTEYSKALRHFVSSLGTCKVIVASREYKGPEMLEWDKLRILPLTFERKETLVKKSLINSTAKTQVMHYLSEYDGALYNNPLFLTLLCRFVGEKSKLPETDYELLENHVIGTFEKDNEFLMRNYRLNKEDGIRAATKLAALYGLNASLGLSPTRSEIEAITEDYFLRQRLDEILAALVACKILRKDVGEASSRDVRYAFGHRRYQEALFVRFILSKECPFGPTDFVKDTRWREYLVTLLQAKRNIDTHPYLIAIEDELKTATSHFPRKDFKYRELPKLSSSVWRDSKATYYLQVLLDGFKGRYDGIPDGIKLQTSEFLTKAYDSADIADQFMVIRFCILCGEAKAKEWLRQAILSNSRALQNEAFVKVGDIKEPDPEFAEFVRRRFSSQVLISHERHEALRNEAMLSRISANLRCDRVYRRAVILRRIFGWFIKTCATPREPRAGTTIRWQKFIRAFLGSDIGVIPSVLIWFLILNVCFLFSTGLDFKNTTFSWTIFLCSSLALLNIALIVMYLARDEPGHITLSITWKRLLRWWNKTNIGQAILILFILIVVITLPGTIIYTALWLYGYTGSLVWIISVTSVITFMVMSAYGHRLSKSENQRLRDELVVKLNERGGDALWVLLQSTGWNQLFIWTIELDKMGKLKNKTYRRLFTILGAIEKNQLTSYGSFLPLALKHSEIKHLTRAKHRLLDAYFLHLNDRAPS